MESKIRARCPFCGSDNLELGTVEHSPDDAHARGWLVCCIDCSATGPYMVDENGRKAIDMWNKCTIVRRRL